MLNKTEEFIEMAEYRVIVLKASATVVFAQFSENEGYLPRIRIPLLSRPARQLQEMMREVWQTNILILDLSPPTATRFGLVISEILSHPAAPIYRWIPVAHLSSQELTFEETSRIRSVMNGNTHIPFRHIGWINDATSWLARITRKSSSFPWQIDQYNAGGPFSLIRFSAEDGARYWLKATGEPNHHERAVTCTLSRLCGDYLPTVIACRPDWNAWLMAGDAVELSEHDGASENISILAGEAVQSMAELQIRTIGAERQLIEAGAFDRRLTVLEAEASELFDFIDEAMSRQTSTKVLRIERQRLVQLEQIFRDTCNWMNCLGIPNTIVHGDMNLGNIVRGKFGCQFIDWCEAYIGNPLLTLEHLMLLFQVADPSHRDRSNFYLKERYRSSMREVCDPALIDKGFLGMPLVAAASALCGRGNWFDSAAREDPRRLSFARSLARCMDRAAEEPKLRAAIGI